MSHFTVLIIVDGIEKQLEPYEEFECSGRNSQYVQDIDQTAEMRADYETHTRTRYKSPSGKLHDPWKDSFYREPTDEETKRIGPFAGTGSGHGISWTSKDWKDGRGYRAKIHFLPNGWEEVEVPSKDFMSFRDFVDYQCEREVILEGEIPDVAEKHKYGYTVVDKNGEVVRTVDRTNPNKKWDWYQIGGRWNGFFKMRPMATGLLGEASGVAKMDRNYKAPEPDRADQALKGGIDFDGMRAEARVKAGEEYDLVHGIVKDFPLWLDWKQALERFPNEIDKAREFYWAQPAVKALRDNRETIWFETDEFLCNRAAYLNRAAKRVCRTFAVVKDGKWYEKGKMGWWAAVHNEKDEDLWNDEFNKLIESIPDTTLLTVVDCHI